MRSAVVATVMLAACGIAAAQSNPQALLRMVATERAFAAATAELGLRNGFLAFFADDAVQIEAGETGNGTRLVSAVTALENRPLAPLPLGPSLVWNPHTGHVSADGSLGWLTGPYVVMDPAAKSLVAQGAYFSVWKRQSNDTWRVWLDEGIDLPDIWRDASEFRAAATPEGGEGGRADETAETAEAEVASGGDRWRQRWSDSVRIHRSGQMPRVGREAAVTWAAATWAEVAFHVVRVETAASNDLAVAIAGYDARTTAGAEHGTWVRVWARNAASRWRIVFETSKAAA
jgi:hypothetical protein